MMQNTLFEILMFVLTLISSDIDKGKFEMIVKEKKMTVDFLREVEVFDEDHKMIDFIINIESKDNNEKIKVVYDMIDNGLYNVIVNENNPFEVDIVKYYNQLDWKNVTKKKQRLKDADKKSLIIEPDNDAVVIKSKSLDMVIRIPVEYFKNYDNKN